MKQFVLIKEGQEPVRADRAAAMVRDQGFARAAKKLGVGDSTLRSFLHSEGFRFKRSTTWQVEQLPGTEVGDGGTAEQGADEREGAGV